MGKHAKKDTGEPVRIIGPATVDGRRLVRYEDGESDVVHEDELTTVDEDKD